MCARISAFLRSSVAAESARQVSKSRVCLYGIHTNAHTETNPATRIPPIIVPCKILFIVCEVMFYRILRSHPLCSRTDISPSTQGGQAGRGRGRPFIILLLLSVCAKSAHTVEHALTSKLSSCPSPKNFLAWKLSCRF